MLYIFRLKFKCLMNLSVGSIERCYVFNHSLLSLQGIFLNMEKPAWLKIKGYYHISPQISSDWRDEKRLIQRVSSEKYVENYAFYPLLHVNLKERKYKKHPDNEKTRTHSYFKDGKWVRTEKLRPLHYANHMDALIYSYYAFKLQELYEYELKKIPGLSECVTAYRKIPLENSDKNKGTIHFAYDAFREIQKRTLHNEEYVVLAFDIKSFFSTLNHGYLYDKWKNLLQKDELPKDHYNVFKSATSFSFIYKNDFRKHQIRNGRKSGFNEKHLAKIRNQNGFNAFFESPKDFRNQVRSGNVKIYKNNFRNKKKEMIGIPQGLPISALLANLYLLDFDRNIVNELVDQKGCYYSRYSDDIVILCHKEIMYDVECFVYEEMKKCLVSISEEKTEKFVFKLEGGTIKSFKLVNGEEKENLPFIYLGFEFYGNKTLIKSTNLSKFYRRMIYSVKARCERAKKIAEMRSTKPILFRRQLYKIYRNIDLDKVKAKRKFKSFLKVETGEFRVTSKVKDVQFRGNYFTYAKRAAEIMNEPAILKQIKGEKRVFNQAVQKHLKMSFRHK